MIDWHYPIAVFVSLALVPGCLAAGAVPAPAPVTGTWMGEFKGESKVQLQLRVGSTSDQLGQRFPLVSLRGLTHPQVVSSTPVQFELVRDAGTVAFEGTFREGRGSGLFTFTPSAVFVEDMAALGFRDLSSRQLLTMAVIDVTREYVRELKALGYDRLSTDQLISLRIFQVTREFVNAMRSRGYDRLQPDQLVQLRIFHVTPEFIEALRSLGYSRLPTDQLVQMRIFNVTPDFIREMRTLGYEQLSVDQLVQMRTFKIDPDLIRGLQKQGYRHPSVGDLVHLRIFGG